MLGLLGLSANLLGGGVGAESGGGGGLMGLLGMMGGGGLVDTAGSLIGDTLTDWITNGSSSATESGGGAAVDAANQAMDRILNQAGNITQSSMYNAAGQVGPAVGNTYQLKADQLGNSAAAISSANQQNAMGDRMLQATNQNTTLAQALMGQQAGNLRRDAMGTLAASGASPAAMGSVLGQLSQQNNQGGLQLLNQAGQQQLAAIAGAGDLFGKSYSTLASDKALQYELGVKPYEAQVNQGIGQLMGQAGQTASSANLGQQDMLQKTKMQLNPLSGLAKGMGVAGTGYGAQFMQSLLG